MSGRLATLVWESGLPRRVRACAAVLAGFAKDDGSSVYPSMKRVAWSLSVTERQAQSLVSELRTLGVLRVVRAQTVNHPAVYRFEETSLPSRAAFVAKQLELNWSRTGGRGEVEFTPLVSDCSKVTGTLVRITGTVVQGGVKSSVNHRKCSSPDPSSDPSSDPSVEEVPARIAPRSLPHVERHDDDDDGISHEPGSPSALPGDPGGACGASNRDVGRDRGLSERPTPAVASEVDPATAPRRALTDRPAAVPARAVAVDESARSADGAPWQTTFGPLDVSTQEARASPQWNRLAETIRSALQRRQG